MVGGNGKGNRGRMIAERLLLLRDYFYNHTNFDRGTSWSEISAYLEENGCAIDRKTFYKDRNDLEMIFGLQLEYKEKSHQWHLMNPIFQAYELRTIINSIQTTPIIPQDMADSLTEKLTLLTDEHTRQALNSHIFVYDRVRTLDSRLSKNLDIISEAIATDRQIQFRYVEYSGEGELTEAGRLKKEYWSIGFDDSDNTLLTGSPFDLTYRSTQYDYTVQILLHQKEKGEFQEFIAELDRIEDVSLLPLGRDKVAIGGKSLYDYEQKGVKVPNTTKVTLIFDSYSSDRVAQKFGDSIVFRELSYDFYSVEVEVADIESLIPWLISCQGAIMIASPPEAKDKLQEYANTLSGAYWNSLLDDNK